MSVLVTRKIGKLIRGKVTPFHVVSASVLGAMLGFVPSAAAAPGTVLALVVLLAVINANLFVAGLVGLVAKLCSLALLPVSFAAGRALIDGPTQPLFRAAANAPVLAWFGLEYYATSGGLLVGALLGAAAGLLLVKLVSKTRHKLGSLEHGSERYQKVMSKKWVRGIVWVFFGGQKGEYEKLASRKMGNPIRPLGVVAAVLLVALVWLVAAVFSEPIVLAQLKRGLETVNGATVEWNEGELKADEGRLRLVGFAMADPNALDHDLFRASELTADIDMSDALRRRVTLDKVVAADAVSGAKRSRPGVLIHRPEPTPPPPPVGDEKTLEDYIKDYEKWKGRLAQVRKWLEKMGDEQAEPTTPEEEKKRIRDRIEQQVRDSGYVRVRATHIIEGSPDFLVRRLEVLGLRVEGVGGQLGELLADQTIDVTGDNLSNAPRLVEGVTRVSVRSSRDTIDASVALGGKGAGSLADAVRFALSGLPGDMIGAAIGPAGVRPIRGGTIDVELDTGWAGGRVGWLDATLSTTVHDATISVGGLEEKIGTLTVPIGLRGPMDNPRIALSDEALRDALAKAGARALADRLGGEAGKQIEKATENLPDGAKDVIKDIKGILPGGPR